MDHTITTQQDTRPCILLKRVISITTEKLIYLTSLSGRVWNKCKLFYKFSNTPRAERVLNYEKTIEKNTALL